MDFCEILKSFPHDHRHLTRYINFIKSRINVPTTYSEKHHIVPKCLAKEYESFKKHPWNKILLSGREHFLAHCMLSKAYPQIYGLTTGLVNIYIRCFGTEKINSRTYELLRSHIAIISKNRHWICDNEGNSELVDKAKPIPIGWKKGRVFATNQNKIAMTYKGSTIYVLPEECDTHIKAGYELGTGRKNYKNYYNPETLQTVSVPEGTQPEGWLNGAPKSASYRYKNNKTGEFFTTKTRLDDSVDIVHSPSVKDKKYYYDPVSGESSTFSANDDIPDGWIKGNPSQFGIQRTKNRKWFKSPCGKISKMFYPGTEPDNWIPGRVMKT